MTSADSESDVFPLLPVIIAGSAVVGILVIVMIVFIIRSKHKKADTPNKKPAPVKTANAQARPSNYSNVSSEKRYEYQAIQAYSSQQGPQHELLHPESSISDASTPHKYASLQHNSTPPPMMHAMPTGAVQGQTMGGQPMPGQPMGGQPMSGQPMMHMQHNPMMHPHTHMHPAHAGMMAYPGVHMHAPAPQDQTHGPPHGYMAPPPTVGLDYDLDHNTAPYLTDYARPPSPTQHVVYKNC